MGALLTSLYLSSSLLQHASNTTCMGDKQIRLLQAIFEARAGIPSNTSSQVSAKAYLSFEGNFVWCIMKRLSVRLFSAASQALIQILQGNTENEGRGG